MFCDIPDAKGFGSEPCDPQDSETAATPTDSKHELLLQHADACRRYADGSRGSIPAEAWVQAGGKQ